MKRKLFIMTAGLVMCLNLLSGCSGSGSSEGSEDSGAEESEAEESEEAQEEYDGIVFGDFDNLGNNPNNLVQCSGGIAFDDDWIYFTEGGNTAYLSRVHYDGAGYETLPVDDLDTCLSYTNNILLNVKDGYVYYCAQDNRINRCETETGDIETIMEYDSASYDITNMLIVDDYLYVVVDLKKSASSNQLDKSIQIDVCNLKTFDTLTVFTKEEIAGLPVLTYDGKNVYFIYTDHSNRLYRIDNNKVNDYFENNTEEERYTERVEIDEAGQNYLEPTLMLAKSGFMTLTWSSEANVQSVYTGLSYSGESFGAIAEPDIDNEYINDYVTGSRRFVIDNSLLLLAGISGTSEVILFPDMDMDSPEAVYTFENKQFSRFGIYNDTLYIIDCDSNNAPSSLISIDGSGEVSSADIS